MSTPPFADAGGSARATARPFVVVAMLCIVGGGLLSAASAPSPSYDASWVVAYLILVGGVAQLAWGIGQAKLSYGRVTRPIWISELLGWNLGNVAVIAGTLLNIVGLLYLGTVLLVIVLAFVLIATRHGHGRVLVATRIIVILLLVSMPVGLVIHGIAR